MLLFWEKKRSWKHSECLDATNHLNLPTNLTALQPKRLIAPAVLLVLPLTFIPFFFSSSSISSPFPPLRPVSHIPQGAMLTVNTSASVSIKTEPVSPGRDRSTPCPAPSSAAPSSSSTTGGAILTAPPQYPGSLLCLEPPTGRSPADSVSSNASSFEGSDRDDAAAAGGGGGASGAGGGAGGRSVTADFSPSTELLRASGEAEQEGGNVKRIRLDTWVT